MNMLEIYVSNITSDTVCEKMFDGIAIRYHKLVADKDCYGAKEHQVEFCVCEHDYQSIMKNGYYLG